MNELIKVNYDNDRPTVMGRDLHEFLEVGTRYDTWFGRMTEYGFIENVDFIAIAQKRATAQGNETVYRNHHMTIDMAKELCMIQRTEKGKQARQYFIQVEKAWNTPEMVMARALKMADRKLDTYKNKLLSMEQTVKELAPAAEFGNAVGNCQDAILVRDFAKVLANDGIKIGQDRLFSWLNVKKYIFRDKSSKDWRPYQTYVDQGLFRIKETKIGTNSHGEKIHFTTKITGKGQKYFYEKLKEWNEGAI